MSEKNETLAIQPKSEWTIAEALQFANTLSNHGWTREANADAASSCIYALCRNLRERGDSAAMREALEKIVDCTTEICRGVNRGRATEVMAYNGKIATIAEAALSAPPRNCDVGDADDWHKRFGEECDKGHICADCPVRKEKTRMAIEFNKGASCEFVWA